MTKIEVVSMRNMLPAPGWVDVRCDRSSVLGNPFQLRSEEERDMVCQQYKLWLWANIKQEADAVVHLGRWKREGLAIASSFKHPTSRQVTRELDLMVTFCRLGKNIRLLCWCAPKRCHADGIKDCLLWKLSLQEKVNG